MNDPAQDGVQAQQALGPSAATREKLILAAERLFGEAGIDAVALRTISQAAGQRNNTSVQYHFGDKYELVQAIFEYRDTQLEPVRAAMLERARTENRLDEVKSLLRVIFEPAFQVYARDGNVSYLKFYSVYTIQYRPRGIPHPSDTESGNTKVFHKVIGLLRQRLLYLDQGRFDFRLETVGSMFLNAFVHYDANKERSAMSATMLLEEVMEMMTLALCAPPWPPGTDAMEGTGR